MVEKRSERHFIIFPARFLRRLGLRLDLQLKRLDEADRRRDVVEDQPALLVVQDGVVVCEALVVAHVVERFQHRDTGFQDPLCHLRFKVATFAQRLDVLAEDGVLSRNRRKFRQPINVACPAPGRWGRPNSRVTSRHFDHGNASRTSRPDCSGLDEAD